MTQEQPKAAMPEGRDADQAHHGHVRRRNAKLKEASLYTGVSRSQLYKEAARGKLKMFKVGGVCVIEFDELDRYIDAEAAASEAA